ncbi:MAG: hypothetical protein ABI166_01690, partial [Mucilaginibacter sp.]
SELPYYDFLKPASQSIKIIDKSVNNQINAPIGHFDLSKRKYIKSTTNENNNTNDIKPKMTIAKFILKWVLPVIGALGVIWTILHAYHIKITV